jgi:Flp pilus assembly protein TadG
MKRIDRRAFLRPRIGTPFPAPALAAATGASEDDGTSRRAFLQSTAGAAAGAAVILATPKVAAVALDSASSTNTLPKVTKPSGPVPHEPVTAYVRNAARGEVTVMSGKRETTYSDPVLVKRMLDAAH